METSRGVGGGGGGGGGGLPCIFNVICAYSTGGRVCQVAAEGGPPPRAGATAPRTCAYLPPTRLGASMPSSGRGRPASEGGGDRAAYLRLLAAYSPRGEYAK